MVELVGWVGECVCVGWAGGMSPQRRRNATMCSTKAWVTVLYVVVQVKLFITTLLVIVRLS